MLVKKSNKKSQQSIYSTLSSTVWEKQKARWQITYRATTTAVIKRPTFYQKKGQKIYEFEKNSVSGNIFNAELTFTLEQSSHKNKRTLTLSLQALDHVSFF